MAHGQSLGNTPYSALGLGDTYPLGNAANLGMGGVGISNANPFYLNLQNPALLATRPPVTVFEVGLQGLSRTLTQRISNSTQSQQNFGANLGYLAVAFPANPRWSMSVSLRPFTYVNYSAVQVQQVPGTNRTGVYDYKGSGGLNKASFATGFRLFGKKNVYVGGEASFLFGNITNSSSAYVALNGNGTDTQVNLLNRVNYGDVVFKLGAAWRPKLSENWTLNLGATYDPQTRTKGTQTDIYQLTQNSSPLTTPDTARTIVRTNSTVIGALAVRRGEADALICGLQGRFIKHARDIQSVIGLAPDASQLSALSMLVMNRGVFFLADTYVNIDPTADEIVAITLQARDHLNRFNIEARACRVM
ncbi:MAG: hypothetical protein EOO77_25760, partial [Oxalobacteraceae bacterium]